MVLSSNHNGIVTETESVDFIFDSVKKIDSAIAMLPVTELVFDKANTNSCYYSFDLNEKSVELRISNHTKRISINDLK